MRHYINTLEVSTTQNTNYVTTYFVGWPKSYEREIAMPDENSYSFIGLVGVGIYGPFLLFCLYNGLCSFQEEKFKICHKTLFHTFITSFALCDLIYLFLLWYYGDMLMLSFAFHEIALFFNYLAFECLVDHWARTLHLLPASDRTLTNVAMITTAISFIILVLFLIVNVIFGMSCDSDLCQYALAAETVCNAACLLLLATTLLVLGIRLQIRIGYNREIDILMKINIAVATCTFFYLIRVAAVVYVLYRDFYGDHSLIGYIFDKDLWWFVLSKWIVLLVPVSDLLETNEFISKLLPSIRAV